MRSRFDGGAIVEQEAVARVLMFAKRIHLRLDVRVRAHEIAFKDTWGRSFTRYEGAWRLERQGTGTIVRYELEATPAFDVPAFLLTRLLRRDAREMIERLRAEIGRQRAR